MERDALGFHLLHAPVDDALLHLEVGDAVAQEAAGLGVLLVDVHVVAGTRELLSRSEPRRAGPDDGDALAGLRFRRLGRDPALLEAAVGDRRLDRLDRHRHVVDVERAGGLARRRAYAPSHLGEVVGRMEVAGGLLPVAVIDEVVPVRDLVVHGAAGVAVGDAAVHAARRLDLGVVLRRRQHELVPMLHALGHGRVFSVHPLELEKPGDLAHSCFLSGAGPEPVTLRAAAFVIISQRGERPQALAALRPPLRASSSGPAPFVFARLASARLYSCGMIFLNLGSQTAQSARIACARAELV